MSASNVHASKLDKYTVLGNVFQLDWQKCNDIEKMVVKMVVLHFFLVVRRLKHGSSYRG